MGKLSFSDLVPGVGSVVGSALSSGLNLFNASKQREFDRRMIEEQNRYNSPAEQVKRLRAAGLNPALAMTNGMMSTGEQSTSAGGQAAPTVDFSPIAQGMRDSVELYQQRRYQNAQIRQLNESSNNMAIKNRWENTRQIIELSKMLSERNLTEDNRKMISQEIERLQKENAWIDKRNASAIRNQDQETALMHEREITERVMRDVNKRAVEQGIRLSKAQQSLFNEQARSCVESVNQMIMNGASQRQINAFIADKERETARSLFKGNENYQREFETKMRNLDANTNKANREHETHTFTFFGVPLGTHETIQDWSNGEPRGLQY